MIDTLGCLNLINAVARWRRRPTHPKEYAYQRNRVPSRPRRGPRAGSIARRAHAPAAVRTLWRAHVRRALDAELVGRAAGLFTRLAIEDLLARRSARQPDRGGPSRPLRDPSAIGRKSGRRSRGGRGSGHQHTMGRTAEAPDLAPDPAGRGDPARNSAAFARRPGPLAARAIPTLIGAGGELDRSRPDARLVEHLDHADPEPGRHAGHGREHVRRRARARPPSLDDVVKASEADRRRDLKPRPRRGRRGGRPDPRQGLPRNPGRPRAGGPARRLRRRADRGRRDRPLGGRVATSTIGGPRAPPGARPLRPGLPRGRGVRPRRSSCRH